MRRFVRSLFSPIVDLWTPYVPRSVYVKRPYQFAFIVHPRSERDMFLKYSFLRYFPRFMLRLVEHYFWPIRVSRITGLKAGTSGLPIGGLVISIPMTAPSMLANRDRARKQIHRAVLLARGRGARIVGLGALTSSLTRGGIDLKDISDIAITTGHAYTGYTVSRTALFLMKKMALPLEHIVVGIVGAAGSIGAISAELLAREGLRHFILIDVIRKVERVHELSKRLLAQYPGISIDVSDEMSELQKCSFVITATNTPEAVVKSEHIRSGTFIIDDAQPADVAEEVFDRKDVVVAAAGAVHTPRISTNFSMGLYDKFDNYCCLAEVLILASELRDTHYVLERPTLAQVDEIAAKGDVLEFRIAEFQNQCGLIGEDQISHVSALLGQRDSSKSVHA